MPFDVHQMPYTDLHSLNLDWIIDKIKKLEDADYNLQEMVNEAITSGSVGATISAEITAQEFTANVGRVLLPYDSASYYRNGADFFTLNGDGSITVNQSGVYAMASSTFYMTGGSAVLSSGSVEYCQVDQSGGPARPGVYVPAALGQTSNDFVVAVLNAGAVIKRYVQTVTTAGTLATFQGLEPSIKIVKIL